MPCILLATDGSQSAMRASAVAAELAKSQTLPLWIVNVADLRSFSAEQIEEFSRAEHVSRSDVIESLSAQLLMKTKTALSERGLRDIHIETRMGDAAQTIIELADEKHASAIVVGKRGHGRLAGLLVGSVTQKLVSLAPCTVIVVP